MDGPVGAVCQQAEEKKMCVRLAGAPLQKGGLHSYVMNI